MERADELEANRAVVVRFHEELCNKWKLELISDTLSERIRFSCFSWIDRQRPRRVQALSRDGQSRVSRLASSDRRFSLWTIGS
jgi:hypothetical protein